jgi:chemotaxis protein MotD
MNSVLNIAARVSSDASVSNKSGKTGAASGNDEFSQALTVAGNSKQKTTDDTAEEPVDVADDAEVESGSTASEGTVLEADNASLLPELSVATPELPAVAAPEVTTIPVADAEVPAVPVTVAEVDEQLIAAASAQLPKGIVVAADGKSSLPVKSSDTSDTTAADDDADITVDDAATDALSALQVPAQIMSLLQPVTQPAQSSDVDDTGVITIKSDTATGQNNAMAITADAVAATQDSGDADLSGDQSGAGSSSDSGKVFRLQKADGTGQSVDLHLSTAADGKLDVEASLASTAQADTVSVLDARRYIGLAPTGNAAMLTAAMSGDKEWVSAMQPDSSLANSAAVSSTGKVVNTLKLQMNPGDLGAMTATMRLSGEELSIHLTVHTSAAYRELTSGSSAMLDALRAQGFSVDQVSVSMASTSADSNSNQQSSQLGQQAAQQGQREGQEARQAQRSGQGSAGTSGTENQNEAASDANVAAARSGHVYL